MKPEIPDQAWERIDQPLLNDKLADIAEDMQRRLAEEMANVRADGRKRGNAGFYPAARIRMEERITDEWAAIAYQAALDVWKTQGYAPCGAVRRAIYGHTLVPLFATRKSTVMADLEDQRTGRPGNTAAARGEFARAMDALNSRWRRSVEVSAREDKYAGGGVLAAEPSHWVDATASEHPSVFICHASEDKDGIARPLAGLLRDAGYRVWYDEFSLTVGDTLRSSIDKGLAESDFGVVILSKKFFEKTWPQQELDALMSKETPGSKVILPVWHQVGVDDIRKFSLILAGRIGVPSDQGVRSVAAQLMRAMRIGPKKPHYARLSRQQALRKLRERPRSCRIALSSETAGTTSPGSGLPRQYRLGTQKDGEAPDTILRSFPMAGPLGRRQFQSEDRGWSPAARTMQRSDIAAAWCVHREGCHRRYAWQ